MGAPREVGGCAEPRATFPFSDRISN